MRLSGDLLVPAFFAALGIAGCTVGPNYHRADAPAPTHWDVAEPWRESAPKDALDKGQWWNVFKDDELTALEKEALDSNQTLKVSVAHLEQARALAAVQVSANFPQFAAAPSAERQRLSRPLHRTGSRRAAHVSPVAAMRDESFALIRSKLFGEGDCRIAISRGNRIDVHATDVQRCRLHGHRPGKTPHAGRRG